MIIKTENLKDVCSKILAALDANQLSIITETLQLSSSDGYLYLSVTNKEYYIKVKLELTGEDSINATVDANKFLNLVAKITTPDVELMTTESTLIVNANGNYKFPLVYDNDKLLELPEIRIDNVTKEFEINTNILLSILQYNSKELTRGAISKPVQRLYYIDEKGALTFTSGACVNNFTLPTSIKFLLNDRLVKLFKLFNEPSIKFKLGYDAIADNITQTKVEFASSDVVLTAIIACDDTLLNSVPVLAIRARAEKIYPYSINITKEDILQTINRLLIFSTYSKDNIKPYSLFEFTNNSLTIWDAEKINKETVSYITTQTDIEYSATLDLVDLKTILESTSDTHITLNFGDGQAFVLVKGMVSNVIPEVRLI